MSATLEMFVLTSRGKIKIDAEFIEHLDAGFIKVRDVNSDEIYIVHMDQLKKQDQEMGGS